MTLERWTFLFVVRELAAEQGGWVGWLVSVVGCCALNRRLRSAAERALASFVIWEFMEVRKLEPCQWPGGSGLAAMRADDLREGCVEVAVGGGIDW